MAEALYRKYRPQVFGDVVGQDHIGRTIRNAIGSDKVSHAYLFTGPRGTGKTTTARLLAKALLCDGGPTAEPDDTCENCRDIAAGVHPDVNELDAASRTGVDNVREEIIARVQFAPTRGDYKVYIIDEVHMLSGSAFNALLKTLEEPPSHVVFILCTTDPQKVPATIQSRCQRFDFHRISTEDIAGRLADVCKAEGAEFESEALELIAAHAEGGMRNALTALEQVLVFENGKVTLEGTRQALGSTDATDMAELVRAIGQRDIAACFAWTAHFVEAGGDVQTFTRELTVHMRNMYVLSLAGESAPVQLSATAKRALVEESALFAPDRLARILCVLGDLIVELRNSVNARLSFEIALTRMARPDSDLTLEALAERIEALESGHSAVAHVVSHPAGAGSGATVAPVMPSAPAASTTPVVPSASFVPAAPATAPAPSVPASTAVPVAPATPTVPSAPVAAPTPCPPAASAPCPPATAPATSASAPATAPTTPSPVAAPTTPATAAPAPATAPTTPSPAAASAAHAPAPAPAQSYEGLSNPATLQRVWAQVVTAMRKADISHGSLFANIRASYDAATNEVVLRPVNDTPFIRNVLQKPEVHQRVYSLLVNAAGFEVGLRYEWVGAGAHAAAPTQHPAVPAQRAGTPAQRSAAPAQRAAAPAQRPVVPAQRPAASSYDIPEADIVPLDVYDAPPATSYTSSASYSEASARSVSSRTAPSPSPVPSSGQNIPPSSAQASSAQNVSASPIQASGAQAVPASPIQASSTQDVSTGSVQVRSAQDAPFSSAQAAPESSVASAAAQTTTSVAVQTPTSARSDIESVLAAGFGSGFVLEEID